MCIRDRAGARLTRADLRRAKLAKARIDDRTQLDDKWRLTWEIVNRGAAGRDLREIDLTEADLSRADLSRASLTKANLARTDLTGADLSGANLSGANLGRATLVGACLLYTSRCV